MGAAQLKFNDALMSLNYRSMSLNTFTKPRRPHHDETIERNATPPAVKSDMPEVVQKPKLLDHVRDRIRVKHYSLSTEKTYLYWIKFYIHFHHLKHPADMGAPEVEAFLSHLATHRRHPAPPYQRKDHPAPRPRSGPQGRHHKTDAPPHFAPQLRHPLTGVRLRHPHGAGAAWPCRCEYDHDLHPRPQPWRARGHEPPGQDIKP